MEKTKAYQELVGFRKSFEFQEGLKNPSQTDFDLNEIEPWAQWQNNLNAELLIIGQEFCDFDTFNNCRGTVEKEEGNYEFPSNKNLAEYLKMIGHDPGHPLKPNKSAKLFFTNCVMGLKDGSMSSNFKDKWINESRINFLEPLIKIIDPNVIICIGAKPTKSIFRTYKIKYISMKYHVGHSPYPVENKLIFPVYHTGGLGLRNRSKENQLKDWQNIGQNL